jgi:hypothetical protein
MAVDTMADMAAGIMAATVITAAITAAVSLRRSTPFLIS